MKSKLNKKMPLSAWLLFSILLIYSASLIFMYAWGFYTSLKTNYQFRSNMFSLPSGWPWEWEWANYKEAIELFSYTTPGLKQINFLDMLKNSLIYSTLGPFIKTMCTWLMAYICARFPYRSSKVLFGLNMVFMMIPIVGSLPSTLQVYSALGLYNNWWFIVVASISWTGQNFIIFYAFLRGVSKELCEAAEIDGASNFRVMMSIVFPLSINMFGILFLMGFINNWNSYMTMVIWLPDYPSLAYGMFRFSSNTANGASMPPIQIAGSMIIMIPLLILFLIFKDKIIGGVTVSSFK